MGRLARTWVVGAALLAAGCGKSVAPEFLTVSEAVRSEVAAHRGTADSQPARDACAAERTRYHDEIAARLDRMATMSGAMDGCLGMRAGSFEGHCSGMQSELDLHMATPCGDDVAANAAEVVRHCDQMERLLDDEASWMSCPMMDGGMQCGTMMQNAESMCTGGMMGGR
jgi:hypothetical protein